MVEKNEFYKDFSNHVSFNGQVIRYLNRQGNSIYFSAENKIFRNNSGSRAALNINLFCLSVHVLFPG